MFIEGDNRNGIGGETFKRTGSFGGNIGVNKPAFSPSPGTLKRMEGIPGREAAGHFSDWMKNMERTWVVSS